MCTDTSQLSKYLPSTKNTLGLIPTTHRPSMIVYASDVRTRNIVIVESQVQGHSKYIAGLRQP